MAEAAAAPATANPVFIKLRRDGVQSGMFIDPELLYPQIQQHSMAFANLILRSSAESPHFGASMPRFVALWSRFGAGPQGSDSKPMRSGAASGGPATLKPARLFDMTGKITSAVPPLLWRKQPPVISPVISNTSAVSP